MRKIIVSIVLLFSIGLIKANPIMPPRVISEFYLINDSTWYLELYFDQSFYYDTILDGYQITTSEGTALLKNGIHIVSGNIIVITQDSLQTKLYIHRSGDFVNLEKNEYWIDEIEFGNNQNLSGINSPFQSQSLVNLLDTCYDYWNNENALRYRLVKENIPSIGLISYQATNYMGTFSGKVYDLDHNPMAGIKIGNQGNYYYPPSFCGVDFYPVYTDSTGEFNFLIRSGRHDVQFFVSTSSQILLDTIVNIEPDSVNYYEINLDTLINHTALNSIHQNFSLSCSPNPSNGKTTISFELPENIPCSNSLIKIFNLSGEMMRILQVDISDKKKKYSVEWDGKCYDNSVASGVYYYNLELNGKKVATNKLIITK
jgi:hypothetical protein